MKSVKKTIAVILVIITIIGTFAACGKPVDAMYVNVGTFYQYFVNMKGVIFDSYSGNDEILSEEEAETIMYDYGYIDEGQLGKCKKDITKDLVAQICVRSSHFRKTGDTQIKDAKKCCDSQAAIDSVAMGIFSLNNNYFEAKKKMSVEDCKSAVEKLQQYDASSHFEEGTLEVVYKDDVTVLTELGDYELSVEPAEQIESLSSFEKPNTNFLDINNDSKNEMSELGQTNLCGDFVTYTFDELNTLSSPMLALLKTDNILVVPDAKGDYTQFDDATKTGNESVITPLAIRVVKNEFNGRTRTISGYKVEPEEYIDYEKTVKVNPLPISFPISKLAQKIKTNTSLGGEVFPGIKADVKDGKITVSFNSKFNLLGDKDKWQEATPKLNITASFYNFKIDSEHLWKICYKKNEDAYVRLTYDSDVYANVDTGDLRFSPANNGNCGLKYEPGKGFSGSALSALKNSRFTSSDSKGSEAIKIAQVSIPIPDTPIIIKTCIYLKINLDGSIEITLNKTNGFEVDLTKTNGKLTTSYSNINTTRKKEVDLKANIDISLNVCPEIDIFGVNIVDGTVAIGININAEAVFYDKSSNEFSESFSVSDKIMNDVVNAKGNSGLQYCINLKLSLYIKLTAFDTPAKTRSCVKVILDGLGIKELSKKFIILTGESHLEDGKIVDKCSRNEEEKEQEIMVNGTNEIVLTTYKENVRPGEFVAVKLTSLPKISNISNDELSKLVHVKSKNEKIATANYDSDSKIITIEGASAGSTEVEVVIPNASSIIKAYLLWGFWDTIFDGSDEYSYTNAISITVSDSGITEVSFNDDLFIPSFDQQVQYC